MNKLEHYIEGSVLIKEQNNNSEIIILGPKENYNGHEIQAIFFDECNELPPILDWKILTWSRMKKK